MRKINRWKDNLFVSHVAAYIALQLSPGVTGELRLF